MPLARKRTNILFIFRGPVDNPNSPYFRDKYEMLSSEYQGAILSSTWHDCETKFGRYTLYAWGLRSRWCRYLMLARFAWFVLRKACYLHFIVAPFQVIVCTDPLFSGTMGFILKHLFACKLVIEVNGDILQVAFLQGSNYLPIFNQTVYKFFIYTALLGADSVRLLYKGQLDRMDKLLNSKKTYYFHDFVPTHFFTMNRSTFEPVILFAGYPFYIKGVDILIKAFMSICEKYPNFILKLVGHELENDAKKYLPDALNFPNIMFCRPLSYDKLRKEFLGCYCFVLPSRSEGIARVLIEAMSVGKPLIGSNTGGIPEVIINGKNGFIFENENVEDLASKLDLLLSDHDNAKKMGIYGKQLVADKYSSEKYVAYYSNMITETLNKK